MSDLVLVGQVIKSVPDLRSFVCILPDPVVFPDLPLPAAAVWFLGLLPACPQGVPWSLPLFGDCVSPPSVVLLKHLPGLNPEGQLLRR